MDDSSEDFSEMFNETGLDDDDLFSNEDRDELGFGDEFGGGYDDFGGGNDYDY